MNGHKYLLAVAFYVCVCVCVEGYLLRVLAGVVGFFLVWFGLGSWLIGRIGIWNL